MVVPSRWGLDQALDLLRWMREGREREKMRLVEYRKEAPTLALEK